MYGSCSTLRTLKRRRPQNEASEKSAVPQTTQLCHGGHLPSFVLSGSQHRPWEFIAATAKLAATRNASCFATSLGSPEKLKCRNRLQLHQYLAAVVVVPRRHAVVLLGRRLDPESQGELRRGSSARNSSFQEKAPHPPRKRRNPLQQPTSGTPLQRPKPLHATPLQASPSEGASVAGARPEVPRSAMGAGEWAVATTSVQVSSRAFLGLWGSGLGVQGTRLRLEN